MASEAHIRQLHYHWDPITLWLLIHGGDPAPDTIRGADRVALALSIHKLAGSLDEESKRAIQSVAARIVARGAEELAQG